MRRSAEDYNYLNVAVGGETKTEWLNWMCDREDPWDEHTGVLGEGDGSCVWLYEDSTLGEDL